ncbi:MAG: Ig-like domain-containing protein [Gammaproteobacteria bacterium]
MRSLGNYGGPTQTMQLLGGLAVNNGSTSNAPSLDQRGYLRDTLPDVGAFEISSIRIAPPAVSGLQGATTIAATTAAQYPFNIAGSTLAPAGLTVNVNSSDTSLLPAKNISVSSGCGTGVSQDTCSLSITPPTNKTGSVMITVTVTDAYGQSGYASFALTIIPPPPVASDVSFSTASNQELSGTLKATEALNAQLNYSIVSQPVNGSVKLTSADSSAFTYTANDGFTGKDSFTFKANDGSSDSNVATVTITVTAPIAIAGQLTASDLALTVYENTTATGTLSILGGSGQGLTISISTKPAHGTVKITDANNGTFTYTPSSGYVGTDSFIYSAKDSTLNTTSNTATVSITVNAVTTTGAAAPIASKLSLATYAGTPITGTLTASDAAGNAVNYAVTQPAHGTLKLGNATTGAFTYTPATGYTGADSFTFTATDTVTKLVSSAATASLTISSIPVSATAVPLASNASFTTYADVPVSATLSASDAAGNALNYVLAQAPAHGTVTITAATGAFVYTPTSSYSGKDSFTFTATDASSGVSSKAATVSLTVKALPSPASTAPTANNASLATYENLPVSGTLTASDVGGNPLTYTITVPLASSAGTVSLTGNSFTYTPASSYTGAASFSFTATDTVTGLASAPATVSFVVNSTPSAPAAPATGSLSLGTYQGIPVSGTLPATDALGTPLTYAVDTTGTTSAPLTAFDSSTGTFTYTPTTSAPSTDSFNFTATNALTGATSAATPVNITISALPGTPGTPLASDGAVSLYKNTPANGKLIGVDDVGNPLSYAVSTQPMNGTVSVTAATGAFTYTPTIGYTGADSFKFKVTDTATSNTSSAGTISLTVNPAPSPPAAPLVSDANLSLYQNQSVTGALSAVAASGDPVSYSVIQPTHGTLNLTAATGAFTYTPTAGYTGTDSFTFTALDTAINTVSTSATVSLSINALPLANAIPLANGASLSLYANQPLAGTLSAVDANGNPLSYAIATQPAHGTVTVTAASGAFTYTPAAGYTGKDSFTFTATDTVTKLVSTGATVALAISSPALANVAPLTSDADLTLYADQSLTGTLSAVDANGNSLSYAVGTKPKNGTVSVTASTGAFVYTPSGGYTGTDSFTFTATDTVSKLASSAATVSLTIEPAPPSAVHHGGPRGGGLGLLSLMLLIPLTLWRRFTVKALRHRLLHTCAVITGLLLLVLSSSPVLAQDAPPQSNLTPDAWYLGGQASIIKPDKKRNASTHGFRGWGLLFGKEFGDYNLEFSGAYHADSPRTTTDIASWTSFGANGSWYFMHRNTSWFSPFAYAGLGLTSQYKGDNSKVKSQYLSLGAGFDSTFGQQLPIHVRTDLQLQHVFTGYNDLILSIGLVFPFGGNTPAWQPAPAPANSPLDEYPMAWCTDKGGHPYHSDQGWVCLPPAASPPTTSKAEPDCDAAADSAPKTPGCPPD